MRLYIDEDSVETVLLKLLRQAGHDVTTAFDARLAGESDAVQFTRAIRENRVLITHNHDDFEELHVLVVESSGLHPGVLVIRKDNDPSRDMSSRGIANAIGKLVASGAPVENQFLV